jgi:hypothetical protein
MALEDGFDIQISGIEEACAMLENVPKDMRRVAFARALTAAAVPVVKELAAWTPVAELPAGMYESPGSLQDHIVVDIQVDLEGGKGGVAHIGFPSGYGHIANWLEFGHRIVAHGAKWSDRMKNYAGKLLGWAQPKPFMRPAAIASSEAAVEAFTESLMESLVTGTTWASVAEAAEERVA